MIEIDLQGESLTLLAERAMYWPRENALLIADPHWGKAATFRASGIPVPSGTTSEAITRLESVVSKTGAQRIFFLGDLLHAEAGRSKMMFSSLAQWRQANRDLQIELIRGNHDKRAGDPPGDLYFDCVDAPYVIPPFVLAHYPLPSEQGYVLGGHVHPGIRLYGAGRQRERLSCFVFTDQVGILPAFGDFTGLGDIERSEGVRIYAIADDEILQVSQ
ncbi:MAG TPA: ligase-associated DNA damage response endonuclease PdeM [Gemmatimonadaceae bacterium]